MRRDPYETLGVTRQADDPEIQKKYLASWDQGT